jgi:hypothetical protein
LVSEPDDRTAFLSNAGEPFSPDHLSNLVLDYIDAVVAIAIEPVARATPTFDRTIVFESPILV